MGNRKSALDEVMLEATVPSLGEGWLGVGGGSMMTNQLRASGQGWEEPQ